ncbi:hypothetical protein [Peribacillus asahii]|uniref:hypothetical protein n=1 Tax=Peribacillus asahii TaxID=228899 RepID=UPI00207AE214|nr:hypothetical protein [Peribacillus asahii]USK84917.1 hypothetical protein LIT35_21475 [Peribacillus asahii]
MYNKLTLNVKSILFISPFIMLMLKDLILYKNVQWSRVPGSSAWQGTGTTNYLTVALTLMSLICVIILSWKIYSKNQKVFSSWFNANLVIVLLATTAWTLITFLEIGVKTTLYLSSSPVVYFTLLAVIIGIDESIWKRLTKIAPILALINIGLSYYYYFSFSSMYDGIPSGNSPILTYFITGFWFLAISVLGYEGKGRKYKLMIYMLIVVCLILSVVIYSRGWMIQCIILLFIASFTLAGKSGFVKFLKTATIIGVIGGLTFYILETHYGNSLLALTEKFGRDTRTFQYIEIFNQTPIYQFILGGGVNARYYLQSYGEYAYIDNQYIFTSFRYGFFILLPYLYFFLSALKLLWKSNVELNKRAGAFIILMWLFALGGLSVYNGIVIDMKNIILPIVAGRFIFLMNNNIERQPIYIQQKSGSYKNINKL